MDFCSVTPESINLLKTVNMVKTMFPKTTYAVKHVRTHVSIKNVLSTQALVDYR